MKVRIVPSVLSRAERLGDTVGLCNEEQNRELHKEWKQENISRCLIASSVGGAVGGVVGRVGRVGRVDRVCRVIIVSRIVNIFDGCVVVYAWFIYLWIYSFDVCKEISDVASAINSAIVLLFVIL